MTDNLQFQPNVSDDEAIQLLSKVYGMETDVSPLASERDQNFKVVPRNGQGTWVLKIANQELDVKLLELENSVLSVLEKSPISASIPVVSRSLNGRSIESLQTDAGHFLARLVSFQPGRVLAEAHPHSPQLLEDLGYKLGELTKSLSSLNQSSDTFPEREHFHWNLDHFQKTLNEFSNIVDNLKVVQVFAERYRERVLPKLDQLRKSLIQNDANDHNVIVSSVDQWPQHVTGLIDFGDMVYASTVNELAIAIAYVMLDKSDPLQAAATVVKAFDRVFRLEDIELDFLFDLSCARLCTSVIMSAYQGSLKPENEYLSVTDQPARNLLAKLEQVHSSFAAAYFRSACGRIPIPHSQQLENWLADNRMSFAPILGSQLSSNDVHCFDLSVSSDDPLAGDLGSDAPDRLWQAVVAQDKNVGLGRYQEPRICYQGDQFSDASESSKGVTSPEPRTIHMGIDLFAPAGTKISVPVAGEIQSFADNNIPFDYGPTIILKHRFPGGEFFSLYGHLSRESLVGLKPGQQFEAGDILAEIGGQKENGGWAPHLHFQVMSHDLGLKGNFPGVVRSSQLDIWKSIVPDPYNLAGIPQESILPLEPTAAKVLYSRQKHLNPSLSISYNQPLYIVRGRNQYLYDHQAHRYLDCVNNVCHVGHCHPEVVEAASKQLRLLNTNTRYLHKNITKYAERLTETLPEQLDTCFFVNSGSEANDLALRLARNFTGRDEVICVEGAYHGHVSSLIDISPYKYDSAGGLGKPEHVFEVPMPDTFRGRQWQTGNAEQPGDFYSKFVNQAIEESQKRGGTHGQGIAAFICESILSCGGQIVLPDHYLEHAYRYCRQHGILCIADEVQVGFGRVGRKFWGFELQNVIPDIVTMGKPIGNGFPLGAVVTTREIAEKFNNGMEYFNTYGGNPVACSAGLAVLNVIEKDNLQWNANTLGDRLLKELESLRTKFPFVGDVRGKGFFVGIEFVANVEKRTPAPSLAKYVVERMKQNGILLSTDGPDNNVIKIKPPMCFSVDNVEQLLACLDSVFQEDFPMSFSKT